MGWMLLLNVLVWCAYGAIAGRVGITAQRRLAFRTGHHLHWSLAVVYGWLWPLWLVVWVSAAVVLPFEKRPASLFHEPSAADRAAREMDRRKEERSLAIQDWQHRAAFWYAEGQRAEAEDDQALKWLVAEQLNFLLETKPDGAKVKGLTKVEERSKKEQAAEEVLKHPIPSVHNVIDWESIERKAVAFFGTPGHQMVKENDAVGFCNICTRYRKHESLAMEGVCRECSHDLGMR